MVECHLAKVDVAGSSPVSRSTNYGRLPVTRNLPFLFSRFVARSSARSWLGAADGTCHYRFLPEEP